MSWSRGAQRNMGMKPRTWRALLLGRSTIGRSVFPPAPCSPASFDPLTFSPLVAPPTSLDSCVDKAFGIEFN